MTEQTSMQGKINFRDFNIYDGNVELVDITTVTLTEIDKLSRQIGYDAVICEDVRNRCDTGDPTWFTDKITAANKALVNLGKLSTYRVGYEMMTCVPPPMTMSSMPPVSTVAQESSGE